MYTLVIIIHVIVCFLMIGAILLQSGKGAEIGAHSGAPVRPSSAAGARLIS